jgi:hypothetical protein
MQKKHQKSLMIYKCKTMQKSIIISKEQESGIMAAQKEETEATETEVSFVAINEPTKN